MEKSYKQQILDVFDGMKSFIFQVRNCFLENLFLYNIEEKSVDISMIFTYDLWWFLMRFRSSVQKLKMVVFLVFVVCVGVLYVFLLCSP